MLIPGDCAINDGHRHRKIMEMFKTSAARACLFLYVRTHAQLQYYLNLNNTRRAANEGGLSPTGASCPGKVVEIHPLGRRNIS
jgi:hypothetical protein